MAISFRFRIIIKSQQPEILIKSEQTLPENNDVLEILQQENCTPNFPIFDTQSVDQICILFKPLFYPSNNFIFTYTVTNLLSKSNCIIFSFFYKRVQNHHIIHFF